MHCLSDATGEFEIIPCLRAIAVHTGQQNLAGAQGPNLLRPGYGVEACRRTPAMRKHFPPVLMIRTSLGINSHDNTLAAKHFGCFPYKVWPAYCGSINRDFVSPRSGEFTNL